jgi:hypothetical protein
MVVGFFFWEGRGGGVNTVTSNNYILHGILSGKFAFFFYL